MPSPYGLNEQQDSVNVVGHDHKRIHNHMPEMMWNGVPAARYNTAPSVAPHLPLYNLAKQALVVAGADGDKVRSRP
jgi:hypothetical protein